MAGLSAAKRNFGTIYDGSPDQRFISEIGHDSEDDLPSRNGHCHETSRPWKEGEDSERPINHALRAVLMMVGLSAAKRNFGTIYDDNSPDQRFINEFGHGSEDDIPSRNGRPLIRMED
ncbi:hypothetical protein CDAR_306211 [Caerostris darwini]|uniref:Uncharacterized protein n=1 Tax=Caerostris darwini TaxID=1538125 RepID=A0AAV4VCW7_9ARAC|nr:hypothetical protein CDAR_306211 [Caerostris darwini]